MHRITSYNVCYTKLLRIEMDTAEGFDDYFNNTYPKALNKLKELAEN